MQHSEIVLNELTGQRSYIVFIIIALQVILSKIITLL